MPLWILFKGDKLVEQESLAIKSENYGSLSENGTTLVQGNLNFAVKLGFMGIVQEDRTICIKGEKNEKLCYLQPYNINHQRR